MKNNKYEIVIWNCTHYQKCYVISKINIIKMVYVLLAIFYFLVKVSTVSFICDVFLLLIFFLFHIFIRT